MLVFSASLLAKSPNGIFAIFFDNSQQNAANGNHVPVATGDDLYKDQALVGNGVGQGQDVEEDDRYKWWFPVFYCKQLLTVLRLFRFKITILSCCFNCSVQIK